MKPLVLCLDISESMGYGEPSKLSQATKAAEITVQNLASNIQLGLVTFDTTAEVLLNLKPLSRASLQKELKNIVPRGVSCAADGLTKALDLILETKAEGTVVLLTDGRANLSLDKMEGFEGSLDLEKELIEITTKAQQRNITVHTIAVGERRIHQHAACSR